MNNETCIIIVLVIIIFFLSCVIICKCKEKEIRLCLQKCNEFFQNKRRHFIKKTENFTNTQDFDIEERIKYYLGNNKKKTFVKLYNQNLGKDVYIINTYSLDGSIENNNILKEMITFYKEFLRENIQNRDNQIILNTGKFYHKVPYVALSRPIKNKGLVSILPFNNIKHWRPIENLKKYDIPYESKRNVIIWRGTNKGEQRRKLIEKYHNYPSHEIDIKDCKFFIPELLQNKFILSIEGNDVASNLKWIMASNSLCIKPQSTKESWLMEGKLKPWVHYVPVKGDFSDLEEIYKWCIENPEICKGIIKNANDYISRFMNGDTEFKIIKRILKEYCNNTSIL